MSSAPCSRTASARSNAWWPNGKETMTEELNKKKGEGLVLEKKMLHLATGVFFSFFFPFRVIHHLPWTHDGAEEIRFLRTKDERFHHRQRSWVGSNRHVVTTDSYMFRSPFAGPLVSRGKPSIDGAESVEVLYLLETSTDATRCLPFTVNVSKSSNYFTFRKRRTTGRQR